MIKVKVINESIYPIPQYETEGSAGLDLKANIKQPFILKPLERYLVPCGLKIELPEGYEAQVRPRSGLALKKGITVLNSPGTIDSDYRGEIHALLVNLSDKVFVVEPGMRCAQLVIAKYEKVELIEVKVLSETARGENGHGSTGVK